MKQPFKVVTATVTALVIWASAMHAYGQLNNVPSVISISIPGAGIVDIQINNYENPNRNDGNKTLLTVHGLAHTGAAFEPLATELFKKAGNDKIDRVIALNFPGRNGSGMPANLQFGNLSIEDYTAILLGTLDQLAKQIKIESIVAHSMGGLIVQMAQKGLRSAGTSLQKEYGIANVYLLAPSIPNPLPWLFADSGAASAIASTVISFDPSLGLYLQLLSNDPLKQTELLGIWLTLFFTNRSGDFAAGTPFTTALQSNYVSNEALIMTLQLLGSNGFVRPSVNAGIFDESVQKCFRIGTFSEDLAIPGENLLQEYQDLDKFLSGNPRSANVVLIDALDAVHDMYIANPTEVAKLINSCN